MNPMKFLQLQNAWNRFKKNHPKFPLFMSALANAGLEENTIIEIKVTTPSGKAYNSNLKLTSSDLELIKGLKELAGDHK